MRIRREKELARERERDKDKERKKRGNRRYGQAKQKHSRKGILSCMTAVIVVAVLSILIVLAYRSKGQSAAIIGSAGIFAMILTVVGIVTGARGFREREKNYRTCKIGIGINSLVLLCLIAVFIRGIV